MSSNKSASSSDCSSSSKEQQQQLAGGHMRRRASDVPSLPTSRRRRSILGLADSGEVPTDSKMMSNTVGSAPYPHGMPGSPCPNKLDRKNQMAIAARRHSLAEVHPDVVPSLSYFTLTNRPEAVQ